MNKIRVKSFIHAIILLPIVVVQSCKENTYDINDYTSEVVTSWNQKIMEYAIKEDGLLTLKGLRTEALMHIAMHDALNAIRPIYSAYSYDTSFNSADPISAVAQAAFEVAISQFPNHEKELSQELQSWLSSVEDSESKIEGINLGKAASYKIIKERAGDNYNGDSEYTWHPLAPGVYAEFNEHSGTPEGFIFGAGWAKAKPFLLPNPSYFRSPPPPDINSEAYTNAFNEVKDFGSYESKSRTNDQAHLAMWWKDFVENSHNRLARQLVVKQNLNLWESARAFALLNMAIYDGYVSVFDNKFHFNHWRPYTAIRWAEHDENPDTEPEIEWNNLHKHTYAFPSYPSAHGTASAAAMMVLANTLGTGDDYHFVMRTEEVDKAGPFSEKIKTDPPIREFNSFSEAAMEASMSRVYLGIHFRYDSEEGFMLGKQIGNYANENFLLPLNNTLKEAETH
jgi:hypothetical protein